MKRLAIFLIDFYRTFLSLDKGFLSLLTPGGACKYSPSCSLYTKQAIIEKGLIKGVLLGARRLLVCR